MKLASENLSTLKVSPVARSVGAEVSGIDLSQPLSTELSAEIRQALGEYGVIFFRNQSISPAQHLAFARQFGDININKYFHAVDGFEEIARVVRAPEDKGATGWYWHTDHSYDRAPALGSVFVVRELPPVGGDTLFASMYTAYESLSDGLKTVLEGLEAWHSDAVCPEVQDANLQTSFDSRLKLLDTDVAWAKHPVVIQHPISGKKALYVNPGFTHRIDGWSMPESSMLLNFLYQQASQLPFTYRHQWKPGDIAFWDNRATWHCAMDDTDGFSRELHRITIEGEPLASAGNLTR
ncbi:MAG: taurine dioxygenase [Parasphingorhabdus sp.]|jgi:taurine dioxygenase